MEFKSELLQKPWVIVCQECGQTWPMNTRTAILVNHNFVYHPLKHEIQRGELLDMNELERMIRLPDPK